MRSIRSVVIGDLTDEELAVLADEDAPTWARTAVEMRERLLVALHKKAPEGALISEVESFSGELRRTASGAPPEIVAQIGRVRGAMAAYVLQLRREMMRR